MAIFDPISMSGAAYVAFGRTIAVRPFSLGDWSFSGGTLELVANVTCYVGIDLFTRQVIALPRLGHRGFVPVAKVITDASSVTSLRQLAPQLPVSRIPRTMKKLLAGQAANIVIIGSSLLSGGNPLGDWPYLMFDASMSLAAYKVPGTNTVKYRAVGGTPNQYQLAQLGIAAVNTSYGGYSYSGTSVAIDPSNPPPNAARSSLFAGVDLVIVGCLANAGDYRLDCIEPIIRRLRKFGCEVLMITDTVADWDGSFATLTTASTLYNDGPEVMRIADLYGCELADTAAYMAEAAIRYGHAAVYSDTIHPSLGMPAGRAAVPSCGAEVMARAIRSVFPVDGSVSPVADLAPGRGYEVRPLPPVRMVVDYKTPADAQIILPNQEIYALSGLPVAGTLGAHPWGTSSFARLWSSNVGASQDLLTVAAGKQFCLGGQNIVGYSMIVYGDENSPVTTIQITKDGTTLKTLTLSAYPFGNEWYVPLLTPTELAKASATDQGHNIVCSVTAGTVKVAALVALAADCDFVPVEEISYRGTWLAPELSRSSLFARPTDVANSMAMLRCPGFRVQWVISATPNTLAFDLTSGQQKLANQTVSGNTHVRAVGGLVGPGERHTIKLLANQANGSQAAGHGLDIGGAIIVNDR